MTIVTAVNLTSPTVMRWATQGTDRFERASHLAAVTQNLDEHDHGATKGLGVRRLQTAAAPAAAGEVQVTGDLLRWWGATAAAARTAVDAESAQTITGAKTFTNLIAPVQAPPGANLDLSSQASLVAMIDSDNNDTTRAFAVRANGVATNLFTVDELGQTVQINNLNAGYEATVVNNSAGANAYAAFRATSSAHFLVGSASSGYPAPLTGKGFVQSQSAAGLVLQNANNGPVQVYVGPTGTTLAAEFKNDGALAFAGTPAGTGTIRLPYTGTVVARNTSNSADIELLSRVTSADAASQGARLGAVVDATSQGLYPAADSSYYCGIVSSRWVAVYAITGTIQTSSRDVKENVEDLAPERALAVVRATRIKTFRYTGAPHVQMGFLAEDTDPLLTLDGKSASPQSTASLALAALQALDARLSAVEGRLP